MAERTDQKKRCLNSLVKVELLIINDWFSALVPIFWTVC